MGSICSKIGPVHNISQKMRALKQITAVLLLGCSNYLLYGQINDSLLNYFWEKELYLKKVADFAFRSKNEQQRVDSNKVFFRYAQRVVQCSRIVLLFF
ncbi:MAG: hypothetical protein KatS3mg028_0810 [Bacteroidia bacterium]|nr:MAG: hypothetical protein KatS3mg028_0810 [Bacteroidia bacterium]